MTGTARRVRPAAVAGMFYPADPRELRNTIEAALVSVGAGPAEPAPKAIVVPHAGYVYSGPVAASAYALLEPRAATIRRVVVLGPAHRVATRSMAITAADTWATPLGEVAIDTKARELAASLPGVVIDEAPHVEEHSIEVQVPFLQVLLGPDWELLPIVVGGARTDDVALVLEQLWGGPETLVVVSSDLSHYHPQEVACRLDAGTAAAIVAHDVERLEPDMACGAYPLRGLLEVARRRDLEIDLLDLRTSADTAGEPSRVVGYGAFSVR